MSWEQMYQVFSLFMRSLLMSFVARAAGIVKFCPKCKLKGIYIKQLAASDPATLCYMSKL